ncbi:MAG: hypothetical protein QF682_06050 [Candidatus Thermoplasmatota archaeon]|jgi:primosomal protein N''|nr:hypothetical protein [Candidatus Thermoplasmatota archaeon]
MGDEKEKTDTKGDTGDRVKQAIDEIGKELEDLEGMGLDVGDAKAFVKHATLALDGKNLKKAVLLTVQAKKFMAIAKKAFETNLVVEPEEESRESEPPELIEKTKDKESTDTAAPEVEPSNSIPANIIELNRKVREVIGEKKVKGIEISEAEGLFELAQKEIRLKEFKYLEEHLNKALEIALRLETQYNERRTFELNRDCNEVQVKVDEISGLGGDPGEIILLLDEIKVKIENLDFDGAKLLLQKGTDKVEDVMKTTLIGIYKNKIMAVKNELDGLKNEASRDFPGLSAIIRSGILALKEGRFDEIDVIIEEFHKVKIDDKKLYLSETLIDKIKLLDKDIEIITELGIEKGNADELMFSAREGLMKERFEEVSNTLTNLKELLENIKTVKTKELTENIVTEIENLFEDLREKAVDISEAEGIMEKASAQKEKEDFIESYRYCKHAKKMLVEARDSFLDRNLNIRLEDMKGFAEEIQDIEYITTETKDEFRMKLEEIGSLFGNEQFLEASIKLPSLVEIESEMKKKIDNHNRTSEQKEQVEELKATSKELDIDISEEETQVSQAEELIEGSRFGDAIAPLDNIITSLRVKIDKKYYEIASSRFETAVNGLKANKEIIDDPERVKEEITKAKELIDKGDHVESIELSDKIIRDIDFFKEKNISAVMAELFDNSQKLIDGNKGLGIEVTVEESLLYRAKHAFENRNVESSKGLIKEARDLMFGGRIEHFEGINSSMGELGLATDETTKHISSLKGLGDAGDTAGFSEMSEKFLEIVNHTEAGEAKVLAKELITRTKGKLTKLGGLPLDLEEEKSMFKDGIRAIKAQKYLAGCRLVLGTELKLLDTEKNYFSDLSNSTMTELNLLIVEAEELGLNVSSINETVERSRALVEEDRFEEASGFAAEARSALEEMVNGELIKTIEMEMPAFEKTAEQAKELGIDFSVETNTISSNNDLKAEGNFREALKGIKETHRRLEEKVLERRKEIKIKEIEAAEQILENIEKDELHNELKFYLEMAVKALDYNDILSGEASLEEYKRKNEKRLNVLKAEELSERLSEKKGEIASLREIDIDLNGADDHLALAADSLSRYDFTSFEEAFNSLSSLLKEARSVKARERARVLVGEAKQLLGQYKDLDISLDNEKEMFKQAVLLIKGEEYVKGCQMTAEIKELLIKAKPEYLKGLLDNIHDIVNENSNMGAEVFRSEAILYKAMYLFNEERYDEILELATEAESIAMQARKDYYGSNTSPFLSEARDLLIEARACDIDTSEIENMVSKSEAHFNNNEFEEGNTLAFEARKKIRDIIHSRIPDIVNAESEALRKTIEEAEGMEVDVTEYKELFGRIEGLMADEKFPEAKEEMKGIKEKVIERITNYKKENCSSKIEEARKELATLQEETGKEQSDLVGLIDSAAEALNTEDFEAVESTLDNFLKEKDEAYRRHQEEKYQEEINQLETIITEMNNLGLEVPTEILSNLEALKQKEA